MTDLAREMDSGVTTPEAQDSQKPASSVYNDAVSGIYLAFPKNLPQLADLWVEMALEADAEADPDRDGWLMQSVVLMTAGTYAAVVLVEDEEVQGFADGVLIYEPATRKVQLVGRTAYVRARFRGQGHCEALYRFLVEQARGRGATELVTHGDPSKYLYDRICPEHEMKAYQVLSKGAL